MWRRNKFSWSIILPKVSLQIIWQLKIILSSLLRRILWYHTLNWNKCAIFATEPKYCIDRNYTKLVGWAERMRSPTYILFSLTYRAFSSPPLTFARISPWACGQLAGSQLSEVSQGWRFWATTKRIRYARYRAISATNVRGVLFFLPFLLDKQKKGEKKMLLLFPDACE